MDFERIWYSFQMFTYRLGIQRIICLKQKGIFGG